MNFLKLSVPDDYECYLLCSFVTQMLRLNVSPLSYIGSHEYIFKM